VIFSTAHGVLDTAVALHQLHGGRHVDRFVPDLVGIGRSLDHRAQHRLLLRRAALHGQQERERHLAFTQIRVRLLAERGCARLVVQGIVTQLEGQPQLAAKVRHAAALGPCNGAQNCSRFARGADQRRALAIDHLVVVGLGDGRIEGVAHLEQLAFGHAPDRVGEDLEDGQVAVLHDHAGGAGVEEVAHQDGALVAPQDVCRWLTAPQLTAVDHVVVKQRRRVQELDGRSDLNSTRARVAAQLRSEEEQSRAHALAAGREHVLAHLHDHGALGRQLRPHAGLHLLEAFLDALERARERTGNRGGRHELDPS
jgi:hypothetical protein